MLLLIDHKWLEQIRTRLIFTLTQKDERIKIYSVRQIRAKLKKLEEWQTNQSQTAQWRPDQAQLRPSQGALAALTKSSTRIVILHHLLDTRLTQSQEMKIEWSQTDMSDLTQIFKPMRIARLKKLQPWSTYEIKVMAIQKASPSISGRLFLTVPSISKNTKNWHSKARWTKTNFITWYTQIRVCQLMTTRNTHNKR